MAIISWAVQSILIAYLFYTIFSMVSQTVKATAYDVGDLGLIPGSGRSPGEGNGNPLQYSCLENSMDGGAWWATVHGVAKSWTHWVTLLWLFIFSIICIKNMFKSYLDIYKYMQQFMVWLCCSTFVSCSLPSTSYSTATSEPCFLPKFIEIWQINQWSFKNIHHTY